MFQTFTTRRVVSKVAAITVIMLVATMLATILPTKTANAGIYWPLDCEFGQGCQAIITSGPGGVLAVVSWVDRDYNVHESYGGGWRPSEVGCTWGMTFYGRSDRAPIGIRCESDSWCDIVDAWCTGSPSSPMAGSSAVTGPSEGVGLTLLSIRGEKK